MSFAAAIFQADDFAIAAIGALMEARTVATNKLYHYTAQFAGDTEQTLREDTAAAATADGRPGPHQSATGGLFNGNGAPLKIDVSRNLDGLVTGYSVVRADGTSTTGTYLVDPNTGNITFAGAVVGYVELKALEGGALSSVQSEINNASAVITTFSNLIAANKQAVKSVLNVIR